MGEWKAIETAPKDGSLLLVWGEKEGFALAAYKPDIDDNASRVWFNPKSEAGHSPSYWCELPPPPDVAIPTAFG